MKQNIDKTLYYEKVINNELNDCFKILFNGDRSAAQKMSAIRFIANYLDNPVNAVKLQSLKKVQKRPDIIALIDQVLEERSNHNFGVKTYISQADIDEIYTTIENIPGAADFSELDIKHNLMFYRAAKQA